VYPIISHKIDDHYFWTDSTIVLSWLSGEPTQWKVFVANRVSEIQSQTDSDRWYHVKGEENPADIISLGLLPSQLRNSKLWFMVQVGYIHTLIHGAAIIYLTTRGQKIYQKSKQTLS
jgi:hypothetical protein